MSPGSLSFAKLVMMSSTSAKSLGEARYVSQDPFIQSTGCSIQSQRRQCGRVVRAPDLESGGPGFKSRSDHYLELFLGSPKFNSSASLVK